MWTALLAVGITGLSLAAIYALGRAFESRAEESTGGHRPTPGESPSALPPDAVPAPAVPAPDASKASAPKASVPKATAPTPTTSGKTLTADKAQAALDQLFPVIERSGFPTPQAKADADKLARATGAVDYDYWKSARQ